MFSQTSAPLGLAIAMAAILSPMTAMSAPDLASGNNEFFVYVGTYTGKNSQGIYVSKFNSTTGNLEEPALAAETPNPTFLTAYPRTASGQSSSSNYCLYAANETENGTLTAYSIDQRTGKLTLLSQTSSRGSGPCHLSVDNTGKFLYAANYGSGSMAALPIKADGSLEAACSFTQNTGSSVNPQRQKEPHAHWIDVDPANQFVLTCDLGLDKVLISQFDATKGMTAPVEQSTFKLPPGSGPRHLAFHPNGRFAYIINEMSNTVVAASWDAKKGTLNTIQSIDTLPHSFNKPSTTAEIQIHPSGKFLYGSNRGHDSITIYSIDSDTGRLTLIKQQPTGGKTPRNFCIDPTGQWLLAAHQSSDSIAVFRINQGAGALGPTGQKIVVGAPVCLQFVPMAK